MATTYKIRLCYFCLTKNYCFMKTIASFIDSKRVLVETPFGDDFIIGFSSPDNYLIAQQSRFDVREALSILFDRYYKGDSSVIMGEISRQLILHGYEMVFSYRKLEKDKERIRIGNRIKELRSDKGLDSKSLALYAGIDPANLCRIESGKYSVGFDILAKIANVLGMKIDFVELKEEK